MEPSIVRDSPDLYRRFNRRHLWMCIFSTGGGFAGDHNVLKGAGDSKETRHGGFTAQKRKEEKRRDADAAVLS